MGSSKFVPGKEPNSSTCLHIAERWQGSRAPSWHFYHFTFSGKVPPKHSPLPDNPHAAGVRSGQAESSSAPSNYATPALQPKQERGGRGHSSVCSLCLLLPTSARGHCLPQHLHLLFCSKKPEGIISLTDFQGQAHSICPLWGETGGFVCKIRTCSVLPTQS